MLNDDSLRIFDGDDELIYSCSLNVYDEEVRIENFLGFTFKFIFEKAQPKPGQRDIVVAPDGDKAAKVIFSSTIRNGLGAGNESKMDLIVGQEYKLLFSVFAKKIGEASGALSVTISFYQKKI